MMKKGLLFCLVSFLMSTLALANNPQGIEPVMSDDYLPSIIADLEASEDVAEVSPELVNSKIDEFLSLTPSKYEELTGEKLGLWKTVKLKAAQKVVKKEMKKNTDISKGIYILLAILGWAWLAMGLMDDFSGNNWIVNLILTLLCWLPGVIHAFIKMKDYY